MIRRESSTYSFHNGFLCTISYSDKYSHLFDTVVHKFRCSDMAHLSRETKNKKIVHSQQSHLKRQNRDDYVQHKLWFISRSGAKIRRDDSDLSIKTNAPVSTRGFVYQLEVSHLYDKTATITSNTSLRGANMQRDDDDFSRKTNTSPLNMRLRISVGRSTQLVHGKHEFISRSVSLLFCNFFSCSSTEKSLIFLYLLNSPYLMMIRTFLKQTTAINGRKKTLCKYI